MAASSSTSPSSSAVTLPRPGKSILKRPPPAQHSFFSLSRLSRLLPSQTNQSTPAPSNDSTDASLKRAHFFLPHLSTVYPFTSTNPPCGPNVKEEKRSIDFKEADRRKRIVRGNSYGPGGETEEWWTMENCCSSLLLFYNLLSFLHLLSLFLATIQKINRVVKNVSVERSLILCKSKIK